jgi:hypothetical protein
MTEKYILEPCGQGHVKKIISKRPLYIFEGGLQNHPGRGHICVKDFGFKDSPYWIVKFMELTNPARTSEFCHEDNLKPLED